MLTEEVGEMDAKAPERMYLWGRSPLLTESSVLTEEGAGLRHYVFRCRGRGPAPAADIARIADAVRVLDRATRMLLVEGSASQIASLGAALPSWLVTEEHAFTLGRGSIGGSDHEVGS
jgi:hypothetical protein